MSWHYRLYQAGTAKAPWYWVVEYYPDYGMTDGIVPSGESKAEVIRTLKLMLKDVQQRPILRRTRQRRVLSTRL